MHVKAIVSGTETIQDTDKESPVNKNAAAFFLSFHLFIFRERGREGEREGEKQQCVVASHVPPTGDLARIPGMCPD